MKLAHIRAVDDAPSQSHRPPQREETPSSSSLDFPRPREPNDLERCLVCGVRVYQKDFVLIDGPLVIAATI